MGERFSDRIIILNTGERFPDRMGPPPAAQAGDLAASPPCRPHRVTLREMAVFTGRGVKIKVKSKNETKRKEKSRPEDELKQDPKAGDEIKPGNPQRKQGQTTIRSLGVDGLGPQGEPQLGRPLRDAAHRNSRGVGQWKTWPLQGPVEAGTPHQPGGWQFPQKLQRAPERCPRKCRPRAEGHVGQASLAIGGPTCPPLSMCRLNSQV